MTSVTWYDRHGGLLKFLHTPPGRRIRDINHKTDGQHKTEE